MATATVDTDLTLGLVALQLDLADRADIADALAEWARNEHIPLSDILVERRLLSDDQRRLIEALIDSRRFARGELAAFSFGRAPGRVPRMPCSPPTILGHADLSDDPFATRATEAFDAAPPEPAARFWKVRRHARGGLGEVHVAVDRELNREVALKELHDHHADDPLIRGRFLVEAEITGALEHPGIVPVYSLGRHADGRPYYAMRLIRGETFKDAADRFHQIRQSGKRPPRVEVGQVLRRFLAVCEALDYAHSRGVIHRDLKPANLMIGPYGETLIVDWGLAKAMGQADDPIHPADAQQTPDRLHPTDLTAAGSTLGTPAFMSPEQALGQSARVGPRSDIYSLGATLYYIITGAAPVHGHDVDETLERVCRGDFPPPRSLNPAVPRPVQAICLKAMALDPADRYASARQLGDDLEHWMAGDPVAAYAEGPLERIGRWLTRHRGPVRAATLALLAIAVAFAGATFQVEHARQLERDSRQHAESLSASLTLDRGLELIEQGNTGRGLIELGRALQLAPPDAQNVRGAILANLSAWRERLSPLALMVSAHGMIHSVDVSDDGRLMVSGGTGADQDSAVGSARVWDVVTGSPVGRPMMHAAPIADLEIDPSGKLLLTASLDGETGVWDLETCQHLRSGPRHSAGVDDLDLSPDATLVATVGDDGVAKVWEVATGHAVGPDIRCGYPISAVDFLAEDTLITGDRGGCVRTWNPRDGRETAPCLTLNVPVFDLVLSPDGKTLMTGGDDGSLRLWDLAARRPLGDPAFAHSGINSLAFSRDGRLILSASDDNRLSVWDATSLLPVTLPMEHGGPVYDAVFTPDASKIVSGSGDGRLRVWDLSSIAQPPVLEHGAAVSVAVASPDGRHLLTGGADGRLRLWDTAAARSIGEPWTHGAPVLAAAFLRDGRHAVTVGTLGSIRRWEVPSGRRVGRPLEHGAAVRAVAVHPVDGRFLTGGADGIARSWDLETGRAGGLVLRHGPPITALALAPDGRHLLTTGGRIARLWDLDDGTAAAYELTHQGRIEAACFSPDGRVILTGGDDNVARFWDSVTGESIGQPLIHQGSVTAVAFGPTGATVLTGSGDRSALLWDVATGKTIGPEHRHAGTVSAVGFLPHAARYFTAADDGACRLWQARPPLHDDPARIENWLRVATGFAFDQQGREIANPCGLDGDSWAAACLELSSRGGNP